MGDDDKFKRRRTFKATGYDEDSRSSRRRLKPQKEEETDTKQYENKPTKDIRTTLGHDEAPRRRTGTTDEAYEGNGTRDGNLDEEATASETSLFYRLMFPKRDGTGEYGTSPTEEESKTGIPEDETGIAVHPKPKREGSKYLPRRHQRHKLEERDQQGEGAGASFSSYSQKTSRTDEEDLGRQVNRRSGERCLRPKEAEEPVNKSPTHERSRVATSKKRSSNKHQRLELLEKDTGKVEGSDEFNRRHRRSKSVEDFNPRVKQHEQQRRASADFADTLDEIESLKEEVYSGRSHPSYQRGKDSGDSKRSPGRKKKLINLYDDNSSSIRTSTTGHEGSDHSLKRPIRNIGDDNEEYSTSLQQKISKPIRHQKKKQLDKMSPEQRFRLTERRSSETSYPDSVENVTEYSHKPGRKPVEHDLVGRQSESSFITSVLEDLRDDIEEVVPISEDITSSTRAGSTSRPLETSKRPDKIYVQGRRGFTSRSVSSDPWQRVWALSIPSSISLFRKWHTPAEFAIFIQLYLRKFYTVCHGLLGGFGFAHCILVLALGGEERDIDLVSDVYSCMSHMVKTWYYFLAVICLVSVLDRADFAHVNRLDFMDCQCYRVYDTILVAIHFVVLFLSNISGVWEEKLSARSQMTGPLPIGSQISREEFLAWRKVSFFRGFLAMVGWILIAVSDQKEMLLFHLTNMLTHRKKKKKNVTVVN